jgi:hypothetical protein
MKPMMRILVVLISAGLGLAAGAWWRMHRQASMQAPPTTEISGRTGQTNGAERRTISLTRHAKAGQGARAKNNVIDVEQWLRWMAMVEKATPDDYARLARMAGGNKTLRKFVVRRWAKVAPKNMFDTLTAEMKNGGTDLPIRELAYDLIRPWAAEDPAAVIAALNGPEGAAWVQYRDEVAVAVLEKDPEQGLKLFHEWNFDNFGPIMDPIVKWADANPQHAAEFALAYPAGYASQMTMDAIGTEWAKTDPEAALSFATAQTGDLANQLAASALKEWAGKDFQAASDWLGSASSQTQSQLSPAFVEVWAQQNPQGALSWCEENLQGIPLQQAVAGVMTGAASKDVTAAAAMVTAMQPGEARTAAARDVAQLWFPNMADSLNPIKSATLDWLAGLDGDSVKEVLNQTSWTWAASDPKGLAAFLGTQSPDNIPSYTESLVEREWMRNDPTAALNWAATLPAAQALAVGAEGYKEWQTSQPEAASAWLNSLVENDPRRTAFVKK